MSPGLAHVSTTAAATVLRQCPRLLPDRFVADPYVKGDAFLDAVAEMHPGLKTLAISRCAFSVSCVAPPCNGTGLRRVAAVCTDLEQLYIERCPSLVLNPEAACATLATSFPKLKILRADYNVCMTDAWLAAFAGAHPDLEQLKLSLSGASAAFRTVTEASTVAVMKACSRLRPDELVGLPKGDRFVTTVAELHPNLAAIDLAVPEGVRWTDQHGTPFEPLSVAGLVALGAAFPNLMTLNVDRCRCIVGDANLDKLAAATPWLEVLSMVPSVGASGTVSAKHVEDRWPLLRRVKWDARETRVLW